MYRREDDFKEMELTYIYKTPSHISRVVSAWPVYLHRKAKGATVVTERFLFLIGNVEIIVDTHSFSETPQLQILCYLFFP